MKKFIFLSAFLMLILNLSAQQQQYDITVTNVVVPVRVFDGSVFVENLRTEDFELYENGVLQQIEALYLSKKSHIERAEEFKNYAPQITRNFYLLFQLTEYNPKLEEAFDYFFNEVFLPEDNLTIMTPMKNYSLPRQALKKFTKDQLSKEMQSIIRRDTKTGSSQYRSIIRDLKRLITSISGSGFTAGLEDQSSTEAWGIEFLLPRYREALQDLEKLRMVDEKWFIMFAQQLKRQEGQKNVFFFYEREFRPEINQNVLNQLVSQYQEQPNILSQIQDLFQLYHRESRLDANRIKQAFSDSSLYFYFIFMNKEPEKTYGIDMKEQSEDVFSTFREVTKATGGVVDPTQNPAAGFKNAVTASENYYLLYYSPKDYKKDGQFKNIVVKVKNKDYNIKHREGYFAR